MKSIFEELVVDVLREVVKADDSRDKFILIGPCYPKDSLLLEFKGDSYVPKKFETVIKSHPSLKWLLREDDIEVDINEVNDAVCSVFNEMFNSHKTVEKLLGKERASKLVVLAHSRLDCYMLFKTVKWAYGSSNCKNVWKEDLAGSREVLVSLNDELAKHIRNKSLLNISGKFKACAREVKGYLDEKLGMVS